MASTSCQSRRGRDCQRGPSGCAQPRGRSESIFDRSHSTRAKECGHFADSDDARVFSRTNNVWVDCKFTDHDCKFTDNVWVDFVDVRYAIGAQRFRKVMRRDSNYLVVNSTSFDLASSSEEECDPGGLADVFLTDKQLTDKQLIAAGYRRDDMQIEKGKTTTVFLDTTTGVILLGKGVNHVGNPIFINGVNKMMANNVLYHYTNQAGFMRMAKSGEISESCAKQCLGHMVEYDIGRHYATEQAPHCFESKDKIVEHIYPRFTDAGRKNSNRHRYQPQPEDFEDRVEYCIPIVITKPE